MDSQCRSWSTDVLGYTEVQEALSTPGVTVIMESQADAVDVNGSCTQHFAGSDP